MNEKPIKPGDYLYSADFTDARGSVAQRTSGTLFIDENISFIELQRLIQERSHNTQFGFVVILTVFTKLS